jgi:hypothetical protein
MPWVGECPVRGLTRPSELIDELASENDHLMDVLLVDSPPYVDHGHVVSAQAVDHGHAVAAQTVGLSKNGDCTYFFPTGQTRRFE